ncbi:hypothetical protein SYNPS1DRAFT_27584 [Syncephalis pseudoplumigaleata]|uniref:Uncharacterized protein n=1 Tax=Syncephalis pseudoplumigaleata TaxID=1712513 RepID=A0A4P9Z2I1_9FUNG|nr:hypothetical protein SYNPS1DRAFT_27584 [Syncephalis pseudoplumigaleata]|eukprot:RKP26737.1 hypothetical protein SYNPS1DRAFT_27584 [Syncephalis pseudoplumigaleata]
MTASASIFRQHSASSSAASTVAMADSEDVEGKKQTMQDISLRLKRKRVLQHGHCGDVHSMNATKHQDGQQGRAASIAIKAIIDESYAHGSEGSAGMDVVEHRVPLMPKGPTQSDASMEAFYRAKVEQFGWGIAQKTQLFSGGAMLECEPQPDDDVQALLAFVHGTHPDHSPGASTTARMLSSLHYWQHPAEQPSQVQSMALLQAVSEGATASNAVKAELQRFHASKETCHMTILFSASASPVQDCLAAHTGVRGMAAVITAHVAGLATYLERHGIAHRRLEKDAPAEALRSIRQVEDAALLLVTDAKSLKQLTELARAWDAHPSYARQAQLPQLVSPAPFLNASVGRAEIGHEKTVICHENGRETQSYRLEINGMVLPTGLQQFVGIVRTRHPDVTIRRQFTAGTALCDALPVIRACEQKHASH